MVPGAGYFLRLLVRFFDLLAAFRVTATFERGAVFDLPSTPATA